MRFALVLLAMPLLTMPALGCGNGNAASLLVKPPTYDPAGQSKSAVLPTRMHPLVVEWPSADRASLEAQAKRGVVAVHFDGTQMELLRQCQPRVKYHYTPITPKHESVKITNTDDLYAHLPLGAATLEGTLKRSGELDVSMTFVGTYESDQELVTRDTFEGDCARATHIVYALNVGSFDFIAGATANVGGAATSMGVGVKGSSGATSESISHDGTESACALSSRADHDAPDGCSAPIRLELAPVGAPKPVATLPELELGEYPTDDEIHAGNSPAAAGQTYAFRYKLFVARSVSKGMREDRIRGSVVAPPPLEDDTVDGVLTAAQRPVWVDYTHARDALIAASVRVRARQEDLDTCRAAGCPSESAIRQDVERSQQTVAQSRTARGAARDKLVAQLESVVAANRTPLGWFALGYMLELQAREHSPEDTRNPSYRFNNNWDAPVEALDAYSHAAERIAVDDRIGWNARFRRLLMDARLHVDRTIDDARAALALPDRPETLVARETLLRVLFDDPDRQVEQARWFEQQADPNLRVRGIYMEMGAACDGGRWSDALLAAMIDTYAALPPPADPTHPSKSILNLFRTPANLEGRCMWATGGLGAHPIASLPPKPRTEEMLVMAGNTAEEHRDYSGAIQLYEAFLQWRPQSSYARVAVARLVALHERAGSERRADQLRALLLGDYAVTSPWADGVRKDAVNGWPGAVTVNVRDLPALPKTDEQRRNDVVQRLQGAVNDCVLYKAPPQITGRGITRFDVKVTLAEARPPTAAVHFVDGDAALSSAAACIQDQASLYFRDAQSSVHVVARVSEIP